MKHIDNGSPITNTEQKFYTHIKSLYIRFKTFYLCDAEQPLSFGQVAGLITFVVFVAWMVLLGAVIMVKNQLGG